MNFQKEISKRVDILNNISGENLETMHEISKTMIQAIHRGNKIMTAGNGGSAANAQHITGDVVGRYKLEREAFAGLTLTVDSSLVTAISNDYGYEEVFARQVAGVGSEGDVLIVLSSSAYSANLVRAVEEAKKRGITTLGILGNNGGSLADKVDISITFPFKDSDLVEEAAMTIFHIILMEMEKELANQT